MALRVAILVQQIFWAVEIYTAVVAAQRVEGYSARPQARHHWRPKNLRADGTVNNGRTVVQVFRLAPLLAVRLCRGQQSTDSAAISLRADEIR